MLLAAAQSQRLPGALLLVMSQVMSQVMNHVMSHVMGQVMSHVAYDHLLG